MTEKHSRRTDEEWLNLIRECRSSGLTDKCWCKEHHIHTSSFYYQIRRLRKMACQIPETTYISSPKKQEIVEISFDEPVPHPTQEKSSVGNDSPQTAIRIIVHGFQIEITNAAASETVFHTLSALQRLC